VVGKYGTRYGASLRKQVKKMEITQHATYTCMFCGKDAVRRVATGIWKCRACKKVVAGGAWSMRCVSSAEKGRSYGGCAHGGCEWVALQQYVCLRVGSRDAQHRGCRDGALDHPPSP
jgi:large subunit ribosomal protein L37Ae